MRARPFIRPACRAISLLSLSLLTLTPGAFGQTRAEDLFQQALRMERVSGDLEGAIQLYQQVVDTGDRALGARALVRIAESYEKLGREGARQAYARIVDEFGDQTEQVELARERLAELERPQAESEPRNITTRQIWSGPTATGNDPTPDGKYLVYEDAFGTTNLAVREIATGETRYLTRDASLRLPWRVPYGGAVSPDSRWIAHGYAVQDRGASLRVVGMDGENLRVLLEEEGCWIQPHGWTADGTQILGRWDCWSETHPEGTFEIVLISMADGTMRVVHELSNSSYGWPGISLSPDDRYLVYGGPVAQDGGNGDIWLLPLDGSDEVNLVQHPADDRLFGWVPGTNQILFLSDRDGPWDLWAASVQDGGIPEGLRILQRDMGHVDPVGFSRDGSFFYSVFTRWFTATIAPFDPVTGAADLDGAAPLLGSNRDLHWSPDGSYLAFVTEPVPPEGKGGRLNVLHLATGERRELVPHVWVRRVGDWSPDGDRILVVGADNTQEDPRYRQGVYAVDVADGNVTPLLPDEDWAVWSSDGRGIMYIPWSDSAPRGQFMYRDLASGEERELFRDALIANERPLELSPDRRHLAYLYKDSPDSLGGVGLGILDMDEGVARQVVMLGDSVNGEPGSVQWTPDGKYIVYGGIVHGDGWRTHVWRVPVTGGEPERLWTMGEGKYGSWFELSPDGRQIAVFTYTQEWEMWVMENLREVLRSNTGR